MARIPLSPQTSFRRAVGRASSAPLPSRPAASAAAAPRTFGSFGFTDEDRAIPLSPQTSVPSPSSPAGRTPRLPARSGPPTACARSPPASPLRGRALQDRRGVSTSGLEERPTAVSGLPFRFSGLACLPEAGASRPGRRSVAFLAERGFSAAGLRSGRPGRRAFLGFPGPFRSFRPPSDRRLLSRVVEHVRVCDLRRRALRSPLQTPAGASPTPSGRARVGPHGRGRR